MDLIISANEEVLHMIKEISVDVDGKADADSFKVLVLKIINGKSECNEV
jgi:hypothetical protein